MEDSDRPSSVMAISTVMAQYFRFMDTKQWDALRSIFTDDMSMSAPDDVPGKDPTRGADQVVDVISKVLRDAVSVHHGHMPEVEILDDGRARGIWAMSDVVTYAADGSRDFQGSGHYQAEFRNTASGWKISSLTLRRLSLQRAR